VTDSLDELAAEAARGDAVAFAEFVRRTQADVWRTCAALVDRQGADDLVQETYLRVHRGLARFDGRSSVRTWLLSVARHVSVDEIRARGRRRRLLAAQTPRAAAIEPSAAVDLELLVAALPDERREAFALTQLVGLSYAEAADVCGCAVGTIRSRVARARADLVAALSNADLPAL
jgi:RNA polymerase sigma-70 factor (ECF subfamily)